MNFSKIPPIFTYISTFGFGIRPKARCFSGQIFRFGLKWKTYLRSFTCLKITLYAKKLPKIAKTYQRLLSQKMFNEFKYVSIKILD